MASNELANARLGNLEVALAERELMAQAGNTVTRSLQNKDYWAAEESLGLFSQHVGNVWTYLRTKDSRRAELRLTRIQILFKMSYDESIREMIARDINSILALSLDESKFRVKRYSGVLRFLHIEAGASYSS